jgi:hypothetical protein
MRSETETTSSPASDVNQEEQAQEMAMVAPAMMPKQMKGCAKEVSTDNALVSGVICGRSGVRAR